MPRGGLLPAPGTAIRKNVLLMPTGEGGGWGWARLELTQQGCDELTHEPKGQETNGCQTWSDILCDRK